MDKKSKRILSFLLVFGFLTLPFQAALGMFSIDEPQIAEPRAIATDSEWEAFLLINALREAEELAPLAMTETLQAVSAERVEELSIAFGPTRPDDRPWYSALDEAEIPYTAAAELIARSFFLASAVVGAWAADEAERAILLGDYTHIGIGHNIGYDTWSVLLVHSGAHTEIALHPSGARYLTAGESLASLELLIETTGPIGAGLIPLTDGMVTGLDLTRAGRQTGTLMLDDLLITFELEIRFVDVNPRSWYFAYVRFVTENGLFNGVSPSAFAPEAPMTRAMFVTVLGRQAEQMGLPITGDHSQFADVRDGAWYTAYIGWAADRGIAQGAGGFFRGSDPVTREQMATFLLRFVDYIELELEGEVTPVISDRNAISGWAREAVDLFVGLGFIDLDEEDAFNPRENATRAVVAKAMTVLVRDHIDI